MYNVIFQVLQLAFAIFQVLSWLLDLFRFFSWLSELFGFSVGILDSSGYFGTFQSQFVIFAYLI